MKHVKLNLPNVAENPEPLFSISDYLILLHQY